MEKDVMAGQAEADRLFARGLAEHRAGRPEAAAARYRQALAAVPGHSDSLHLLGVLAFQAGRTAEAIRLVRQAIAADDAVGGYHANLAMMLLAAERPAEALAAARRAVALSPTLAEAWNNLGNALARCGQAGEALDAYRQALDIAPAYAEAHNGRGLALLAEGRPAEAAASFREAMGLAPDHPDAEGNLASALTAAGQAGQALIHAERALARRPRDPELQNLLGSVLAGLGRYDQALPAFRQAVSLKPGFGAAVRNLADCLSRLGRRHEAVAIFAESLEISPEDPAGLINFGTLLMQMGRLDGARRCYRNAVVLAPDMAEAFYNLGNLEAEQGHLARAIALQDRALAVAPGFAEARLNRGMAHLLAGQLEAGWRDYAWRWLVKGAPAAAPFQQPRWSGEAGKGGTILLWAEQGAGDAIQFIRFAPLVARRGWRVKVRAPASLTRLFSSMPEIEPVPEDGPAEPFDRHCSLMELPEIFGTRLEDIPAAIPYLQPDPVLVRTFGAGLPAGFKVGVAWRGNPTHRRDRQRSMTAGQFGEFLRLRGIVPVSLQKDATAEECRALGLETPQFGDYADTAALISCLDLVISIDSSVCHLAGALGAAVWTLLDAAPDWRWLQDRADSPWYPGMRLFRQSSPGDWQPVLTEVGKALARTAGRDSWWRRLLS